LAPFLITFLSPETATFINIYSMFTFIIIHYDVRFIFRGFHDMVTLTSQLVPTNFGTSSCQCSSFNFSPISTCILKCT
jgi:hypothetical protein